MPSLPRTKCENPRGLDYDDHGWRIVADPNFDEIWHVRHEAIKITDERLNHPPTDW
jgi:hypothetical protein